MKIFLMFFILILFAIPSYSQTVMNQAGGTPSTYTILNAADYPDGIVPKDSSGRVASPYIRVTTADPTNPCTGLQGYMHGKVDATGLILDSWLCTTDNADGTTNPTWKSLNTPLGTAITALTAKTVPVRADTFPCTDSAASFVGKECALGDTLDSIAVKLITSGTNPTCDDPGEICHDTTANQVVLDDNVVGVTTECRSYQISNPDGGVGSTDIEILPFGYGVTITSVECRCQGTCGATAPTWTFDETSDGTNFTLGGTLTCASTTTAATQQTVTANGVITQGHALRFDITNTPTTTTDDYLLTFCFTRTRQ